jgi:4-hydroxythreonine-4-phosphate dehydrogenase
MSFTKKKLQNPLFFGLNAKKIAFSFKLLSKFICMIYVTQGSSYGVGLEVFFKALLNVEKKELKKMTLIADPSLLSKYPSKEILQDIHFVPVEQEKSSIKAIQMALQLIEKDKSSRSILFNLPANKKDFITREGHFSGHTEYYRSLYPSTNLVMSFIGHSFNCALITDHIPLHSVPSVLTEDLIYHKSKIAITHFSQASKLKKVIFAGINPHAGDNGLIGHEDEVITKAIGKLQQEYPGLSMKGPLSGDSMLLQHTTHSKDEVLYIYMYHDQGLGPFKALHKLEGINMTLGLPFIRVSVDHGTAEDLFGKNLASPAGCEYVLNYCLHIS